MSTCSTGSLLLLLAPNSMLFLFLQDYGPSAPFRARLPLILARPRVTWVACVPDCGRLPGTITGKVCLLALVVSIV